MIPDSKARLNKAAEELRELMVSSALLAICHSTKPRDTLLNCIYTY